jgi:prepilin-type N-terminal cleavage/methylation domain-containing protein
MKHAPKRLIRVSGFSLVEIAVVLFIIAILTTAIAMPLATQLEVRRLTDTQQQLETIKEAIYGFAMANGRVPCPATATSSGRESFCTTDSVACGAETFSYGANNGRCFVVVGLVPASTLGLSPVDAGGYLVDAWSDGAATRRIRYTVSRGTSVVATTNVFTRTNGIQTATMSTVAATANRFLSICATGLAGAPPTTDCGTLTELTKQAPFAIYSLGKDASTTSFDSINNQNGDEVFTSGTQLITFDDIVTWGSLNTLFARMVQAGKLP